MRIDPPLVLFKQIASNVRNRAAYYLARLIVIVLFASIVLSPKWLNVFLGTPILLAVTILGTVVLALTLFADLLLERQWAISSIIFKYFFLTLSVILAFGLFFYLNSTMIQPPGLHYNSKDTVSPEMQHDLEVDVFYLSATTYYTIGYGDIVPLGNNARIAAVAEAFVGSLINLIVLAIAFQNLNKKWETPKGAL
jgi:hypothetical protein